MMLNCFCKQNIFKELNINEFKLKGILGQGYQKLNSNNLSQNTNISERIDKLKSSDEVYQQVLDDHSVIPIKDQDCLS